MDAVQLDGIIKTAEAIDKFGALLIGCAIFMFLGLTAIFFVFSRHKKVTTDKDSDFQKMFNELQSQNQQVFSSLMQSAFKANQPELVSEGISATGAVHEQLKQVAAIIKADRIGVYAFHNGTRMMNGRHIIKFSCWAEFAILSKFVRIDKHKDVQVSRIQDICNALLKEHRWEALTEDKLKESQLDMLEEMDVMSAFVQAVYSADGIVIGFVIVEYLLSPVETTWVEKARSEIKKLSDKVSIVLDIELK